MSSNIPPIPKELNALEFAQALTVLGLAADVIELTTGKRAYRPRLLALTRQNPSPLLDLYRETLRKRPTPGSWALRRGVASRMLERYRRKYAAAKTMHLPVKVEAWIDRIWARMTWFVAYG